MRLDGKKLNLHQGEGQGEAQWVLKIISNKSALLVVEVVEFSQAVHLDFLDTLYAYLVSNLKIVEANNIPVHR